MELAPCPSATGSCSVCTDKEYADESNTNSPCPPPGPVSAGLPRADASLSDAESVGCPAPAARWSSGEGLGWDPPGSPGAAVVAALLTDDGARTLLSRALVRYCVSPSSRVGDHPVTLAVGAVVQSAFHGVEPPREWVTAVGMLPPHMFTHTGLAEVRRWVRRAVGAWRRCPAGPGAARLEAAIANLLDVRDWCREELAMRNPGWMAGMFAVSWGATLEEWEERATRQAWLVQRFLVTGEQAEALRAALAEYDAGGGGGGGGAALPPSPGSPGIEGLAGVLSGRTDAMERYIRLGAALMRALTWRQRAAACVVMFPYGSEYRSMCVALVAKGRRATPGVDSQG